MSEVKKSKYINPYIGGVLLGLVILAAFFISGRGIGASGAIKSAIVTTVNTVAPTHAENNWFYEEYNASHANPMKSWLVFEIIGVLIGAFISGAYWKRLKLKVEHSPKISSKRRLIFAVIGGILFGFGSQFGRGCASGACLSGMSLLSVGSFVTMIFMFGTAFIFAYIFRKNYI
ncbi:hypothetical protein BZG02_13120 [Labilibaculum filiforme]|uniref:Uncharacterized protein n=1 Tax=Labilibaculum filiforme TaxID=1940526 RepID=A0A2N3HW49_9BACT|nr:YeeE/YedE thiosulfate transporter family protein [Labilibaculum filiforme]PKQ62253.1 hypothetical protein BZG02_13120 [Labilibaculum filiforme]